MDRYNEQRTLSYINCHALLSLLEPLSEYDNETREMLKAMKFSFQIIVSGGPTGHIVVRDGKVKYNSGKKRFASLSLWFPSPEQMNGMFKGKKSTLVPLFTSIKFPAYIQAFKALSGRFQYYMQGNEQVHNEHREFITALLLEAASRGIKYTAEYDPYIAPKAKHIPDGVLDIFIEEKPEIGCSITKAGEVFTVKRGRSEKKPNAMLIFRDIETAYGVLKGKTNATVALGLNRVSIRGYLPIVRGIFPVLDRLGRLLSN
jgi:hypothetical protein